MSANFWVSSLIKSSSNSDALLINDGFSVYLARITPAFAVGLKRSGKPVRQHALVKISTLSSGTLCSSKVLACRYNQSKLIATC